MRAGGNARTMILCLARFVSIAALWLTMAPLSGAAPEKPGPPRSQIIGTWRGTSTCVGNPKFPACHDEIVVYRFEESPSRADAVLLKADKIVEGQAVPMYEIEFHYDGGQNAWASEFRSPGAHGLWTYFVRATEMTGTLVELPEQDLVRNVAVRRD